MQMHFVTVSVKFAPKFHLIMFITFEYTQHRILHNKNFQIVKFLKMSMFKLLFYGKFNILGNLCSLFVQFSSNLGHISHTVIFCQDITTL